MSKDALYNSIEFQKETSLLFHTPEEWKTYTLALIKKYRGDVIYTPKELVMLFRNKARETAYRLRQMFRELETAADHVAYYKIERKHKAMERKFFEARRNYYASNGTQLAA